MGGGYAWIGKEKRKEEIVACGDLILGQKEIYENSSDWQGDGKGRITYWYTDTKTATPMLKC